MSTWDNPRGLVVRYQGRICQVISTEGASFLLAPLKKGDEPDSWVPSKYPLYRKLRTNVKLLHPVKEYYRESQMVKLSAIGMEQCEAFDEAVRLALLDAAVWSNHLELVEGLLKTDDLELDIYGCQSIEGWIRMHTLVRDPATFATNSWLFAARQNNCEFIFTLCDHRLLLKKCLPTSIFLRASYY